MKMKMRGMRIDEDKSTPLWIGICMSVVFLATTVSALAGNNVVSEVRSFEVDNSGPLIRIDLPGNKTYNTVSLPLNSNIDAGSGYIIEEAGSQGVQENSWTVGAGGDVWAGNVGFGNTTENHGSHYVQLGVFADNFNDNNLNTGWNDTYLGTTVYSFENKIQDLLKEIIR